LLQRVGKNNKKIDLINT
jgi:hypothetical protein